MLPQSGLSTHFARTYFTSDQIGEESVDLVLCQFWEVDSGGVCSLPVMTAEDKMILDRVQKSIKLINGHYQVAIPWREFGSSIPNNYKMTTERLQKLERRLRNNTDIAMAYNESIRRHIQEGYVKRVEPVDEQPVVNGIYLIFRLFEWIEPLQRPMWYLMHQQNIMGYL